MKRLEEVFKRSGLPTYTFVQPAEYTTLLVSIRTHGRGTIVEGPSGIGKTTSVLRILNEIEEEGEGGVSITKLSGRNPDDYDLISSLPEMGDVGVVLIDDFHRLPDEVKYILADYIKLLADKEDQGSKIIIAGINKAGQSLLNYASDLSGRIDTISFEANPEHKVQELIRLGEEALNIRINIKDEMVEESQGSFHLAQMLCHECCLEANIIEEQSELKDTRSSIEVIKERVLNSLSQTFFEKAKLFATGPKLRKEGRAPYFYLLYWLSDEKEWTLNVADAIKKNPEHRGSVGQIMDKGFLEGHINKNPGLQDVIHFDRATKELSIEDPKFFYYLRNLLWSKFCEKVGYQSIDFSSRYDYALSFAGSDRELASALFDYLTERELAVFYDKNEQHRILAENVEDYLAPIYKSEATYVVALLGPDYPRRIWTKFESNQFAERFGQNSVIPVWFSNSPASMFDISGKYGGVVFDPNADFSAQVEYIGDLLCKKIVEHKEELRAKVDNV